VGWIDDGFCLVLLSFQRNIILSFDNGFVNGLCRSNQRKLGLLGSHFVKWIIV